MPSFCARAPSPPCPRMRLSAGRGGRTTAIRVGVGLPCARPARRCSAGLTLARRPGSEGRLAPLAADLRRWRGALSGLRRGRVARLPDLTRIPELDPPPRSFPPRGEMLRAQAYRGLGPCSPQLRPGVVLAPRSRLRARSARETARLLCGPRLRPRCRAASPERKRTG